MKKKCKSILSVVLAAAMLIGTVPAYDLSVMAAETGLSAVYTQALDKATTVKGLTAEDSAALTEVNKSSGEWEHSPSGKALSITANNGEVRVHLPYFGDGAEAVSTQQAAPDAVVSAGDAALASAVSGNDADLPAVAASGNPGLADGIYEISMRTGDKLYGNVGFLARYKDENSYAGMTIDFATKSSTYSWICQYSTGGNARANDAFSNSGVISDLKANTDYLVELKYQGTEISCRVKEQGSSDYIDLGSITQTKGTYYNGAGGLAIRLNPGNLDGKEVIVDNIVQKSLDGAVVKTMNFDDGVVPEYMAYANKGAAENHSLATLAIVDLTQGDAAAGFGEAETVNKLTSAAGGIFVDEASPVTDNGIYTVKTNGTVNHYGLVFNYKDADNYTAVIFDGKRWMVEGRKAGAGKGIVPVNQPQALTEGTAHTLVLDYTDMKKVSLKVDGNDAVELGDLTDLFSGAGKAGLMLGEAGTLYTGAIQLSYTKEESSLYDPGLPEVVLGEGEDDYTQSLVGGQSTLVNGSTTVPSITVNESPFGMEDKVLSLKGSNDTRVKLTHFNDGPADGSYEFAFRTTTISYSSVGFLARYVNESQYVGLSIDSGVWTLHAATGLSSRQNTAFPNQYEALRANTTYKVKMDLAGNQVSVKVMKEGDADYFDLGTVTSQGHTGGGSFAVRLRSKADDFYMDNIVQYDTAGNVVKSLDFNDEAVPAYEARENKNNTVVNSYAALEIIGGYPTEATVPGLTPGAVSVVEAGAAGLYIDSSSPIAALGTMTVQLKGTSSKYGIVFNYQDDDNYATIEYDGAKWIAGGKNGGDAVAVDLSGHNIPAIEANDTRTLRLAKTADGYTLYISGGPETTVDDYETYKLGTLEGIFAENGKIGVVTGEPMTLYVGRMNFVYLLKAVELPIPTENVIKIKSEQMQAVVGDTFPHIYTYLDQKGGYLTGTGLIQGEENTGMTILTDTSLVNCTTSSVLIANTDDSATYEVTAQGTGLEAVFTVVLKVVDNTLELKVTDVDTRNTVRTFMFNDLPMVAVAGRGAGMALGNVNGWGPASDTFVDLKSSSGEATYNNMTYALFYDKTSGVTAAVENNVERGTNKYVVKQDAVYPYLSASNTAWAWQYYDNTDPQNNLPYAKVVVAGDENGDGETSWQDAGIAYRDIMIRAYGNEDTKNEWMYIAMNMSSGASQPFLRVLDEAKAISYLTDGFGMKIMNKGYQAGGHDDSHGDYDFIGTQQGGAEDFNTLINEGLKYGIKNGVHINATEFALDGYDTTEEILTKTNGELIGAWGWFDKAFHINKSVDISSGYLERRLDEFEEAAPNLDFIYVDVYQSGSTYNATEFIRYMNENGVSVGTEALGDFNQQINFVHWNTDLNYSSGGNQSEVLKFVTYGQGDLTAPDHALLGALMPGVADWRNSNDFNAGERVFYRNNLATKYLQHFELLSWTPDEEAILSDNVRTEVKEENGSKYTLIYKDDKLLAKINTSGVKDFDAASGNPVEPFNSEIFIPWSPEVEDKIYCYNDISTSSTWAVPDSWADVTQAYLYQLTENGRTQVGIVPVTEGKVQLTLTLSTPYILVKEEAQQAHRYDVDGSVMMEQGQVVMLPSVEDNEWGYGSPVKNFGFTGKTFEGWTKNATEGDAADIAIDTTIRGTKGNPRVVFPESVAGSISQTVAVEPGKTYSFSAWTMAEGARSPKLTVQAGNVTKEAGVLTTDGIPITIRPSKYTNMDYQRLKVNITIPAGVTAVTLTFSAKSGEAPVYVDDFRCWEWLTAPNPAAEDYYYFEDFENVDENWGTFISQVTNQPYIHLSYKNPEGGQMKYFTLDTVKENGDPDKANLTALKGRQTGSYGSGGIMMRTLPSTLDFKQGTKYLVEIDHATYREELFATEGRHIGYNYPLETPLYYMDVRSANGAVIASYPLKPSTFEKGDEGYNARPSTELLSFMVDATEQSGIYLTLRRDLTVYQTGPDGKTDASPLFVLDNVRVSAIDDTKDYTITIENELDGAELVVKDVEGKVVDPQSGNTYVLKPGSYSYTLSADGYVTKSANFTANKDKTIQVELNQEAVVPVTYEVTIDTIPANATVVLTDAQDKVVEAAEGRTYKLEAGKYTCTVSAEGYITKIAQITVSRAETITLELEKKPVVPETYEVKFATTPADATVVVKDAQDKVVEAAEGKTYKLEAGKYSYTVSAEGYDTKTADFTVSEAGVIKVELKETEVEPVTYEVTFITDPANAAVEIRDAEGKVVEPTGDKIYALKAGKYTFSASAEGYDTMRADFTVDRKASFKLTLMKKDVKPEPAVYKVSFATTPENAVVVVKDGSGKVMAPAEGKTYTLEEGSYSYTVSAEGYVAKTADFKVSEAASIKVELEKETVKPVTYKVTFATTPENAAVVVKDIQGNVVAPAEGKTYVLEAGSYNYTVSAEGYVTKMAAVQVKGEETITVELLKTTAPDPDPTPGGDDNDNQQNGGSDDQNAGGNNNAGQTEEVKAPKTADNAPIGIIMVIAGLGIISVAGVTYAGRRKKQ